MEIKSITGTIYNISSDGSRMEIKVTKNNSTSVYIAPAKARITNSRGVGSVILVTRSNGNRIEMPIEKMGILSAIESVINSNS